MAAALQIQKGPSIAARARCGLVERLGRHQLPVVECDAAALGFGVGIHHLRLRCSAAKIGEPSAHKMILRTQVAGKDDFRGALCADGGFIHVHFLGSLKQAGAADGVEQRETVDISRAAVNGTHGAGSAKAQQLGLLAGSIGVAELLQALFDEIGLIEHFRSFLTRSADYSDGLGSSYKAEGRDVSSGFVLSAINGAELGAKAACQDRKYARSGHAVDAVRVHSLFASLTRSIDVSLSSCFFVSLTPARLEAYRLSGQISASIGSGGTVLVRTVQNHRQNRQLIEIIKQSCSVLWFRAFASRHAWAGGRVRLCAYTREGNPRTSELYQLNYILHIDISSSLGSVRFWSEPQVPASAECVGFLRFWSILAGRYGAIGASSGLLRGCPGESFGLFCGSAAAMLDPHVLGSIDGFLRLSAGRYGSVGMVMLERCAEVRSIASVSGNRPLPIGKASTIAQVPDRTPPMPPLPIAATSCSLALQTGGFWNGLRRLNHIGEIHCRQGGARRNGGLQIGSGKGRPVRFDPLTAGRGMRKTAGKLHRICQATGGLADVN